LLAHKRLAAPGPPFSGADQTARAAATRRPRTPAPRPRRPSRSRKIGSSSAPILDPRRGYDRLVIEDPLKGALEEIAPKLDPGLDPLAAALLAEEPVEDAWAALLQEILDAA